MDVGFPLLIVGAFCVLAWALKGPDARLAVVEGGSAEVPEVSIPHAWELIEGREFMPAAPSLPVTTLRCRACGKPFPAANVRHMPVWASDDCPASTAGPP